MQRLVLAIAFSSWWFLAQPQALTYARGSQGRAWLPLCSELCGGWVWLPRLGAFSLYPAEITGRHRLARVRPLGVKRPCKAALGSHFPSRLTSERSPELGSWHRSVYVGGWSCYGCLLLPVPPAFPCPSPLTILVSQREWQFLAPLEALSAQQAACRGCCWAFNSPSKELIDGVFHS